MGSKMKKIALLLGISACLMACKEEVEEDIVIVPNKDGAIEIVHKLDHTDSFDIHITTSKVWVKNQIVKTTVVSDTLPSLGSTTEDAENMDGETIVTSVPKQYEFYISVQ